MPRQYVVRLLDRELERLVDLWVQSVRTGSILRDPYMRNIINLSYEYGSITGESWVYKGTVVFLEWHPVTP